MLWSISGAPVLEQPGSGFSFQGSMRVLPGLRWQGVHQSGVLQGRPLELIACGGLRSWGLVLRAWRFGIRGFCVVVCMV